MIVIDAGYVVVDGGDNILFGTLSTNRKDSWKILEDTYRSFGFNRTTFKKQGYKCVHVMLRTDDYKR